MKKTMVTLLLGLLLLLPTTMLLNEPLAKKTDKDLDPLLDLKITIDIKTIRTLEKTDLRIFPIDKIDPFSDPDFYVKIIINDQEYRSETWYDTKYLFNTPFSVTADIPDDQEWVNITIQLWDENPQGDSLCDISDNWDDGEAAFDVDLFYNVKVGHWQGDDYLPPYWGSPDRSGYGRLNGCDDRSYYQNNRDCELWFDIYCNDYDEDMIPYWTETTVFHTDPMVDNTGEDVDDDGIPIEWEYKWGYFESIDWENFTWIHDWKYDPFEWDDHQHLDFDNDGLDNWEEYRTSRWGSDPFRKDLFVELDRMESGPNGEPESVFPEGAKHLLQTAYDKHNVVYHLDDGHWQETGSEMIPFDDLVTRDWFAVNDELTQIYNNFFLHNDEDNWRKGVFHYGVLIYKCDSAAGAMFGSDCYYITSNGHEKKSTDPFLDRDVVFASAYMHECGHTLGIMNPGVDDRNSMYPWQLNFWKWRPYKSVMNYGYMYKMVDYSDGSRGLNDFDDWHDIDLTYFQDDFF